MTDRRATLHDRLAYATAEHDVPGASIAVADPHRGRTDPPARCAVLVPQLGLLRTRRAGRPDDGGDRAPAAGGDGPLATVPGIPLPRSNAPAGSIMRAAPRELARFGRMVAMSITGVQAPPRPVPPQTAPGDRA
jgi:hypothetical protein